MAECFVTAPGQVSFIHRHALPRTQRCRYAADTSICAKVLQYLLPRCKPRSILLLPKMYILNLA